MTLARIVMSVTEAASRTVARVPRPVLLAILLAYGVAVAFAGVHSWRFETLYMMGTRVSDIAGSLRTLEAGGPPLINCTPATDEQMRTVPLKTLVKKNVCSPAGYTDDQGLSLFVPWVAQLTGTDSPSVALHRLFIACFFVLFALYPLLFYGILGSLPAALAAPWILRGLREAFVVPVDHYWVAAWGILLGIPIAWVLFARWERLGRWTWPIAAGTTLLASAITAMRINAGLPVALAVLAVVLAKGRRWKPKLLLAALTVAAYLVVYPFGMDAVRAYRDHAAGASLSESYPARHPVWHNAYIGLGVFPNPYGIRWNDTVSADFVKAKDPSAVYLSPRYESILRDEYFRLLIDDPGFVVRTYLVKADTLLRRGLGYFWVGLLAAAVALAVGTRRRLMRRLLPIAAPAAVLGAVPSIMTIPDHEYQLGWLGALGAWYMLGVAWVVAEVGTLVTRRTLRARPPVVPILRGAARSAWLWAIVAVVAGGAAIMLARALVEPNFPSDYYHYRNATPVASADRGAPIVTWSFANGLPGDWATQDGAAASPSDGRVGVVTSTGPSSYQLGGPSVVLPPGRYVVHVKGDVPVGGIEVGALDSGANRWLATTRYWEGQAPFPNGMETPFDLAERASVRVILANWSNAPRVSRWTVREVSISRRTG